MSILLEALKKSESQRRLGATPTLETPDEARAPAWQRSTAWGAAAIAVLAVSLMAWVGWKQFRPPAGPAASEVIAGGNADEPERPADTGTAPPRDAELPSAMDLAPPVEPRVSMGAQRPPAAQDAAEKRRLLDRTFRTYASKQQESGGQASGADDSGPPADSPAKTGEVPKPSAPDAAVARAVKPGEPAPPPEEPRQDTISYWQIPASLRDSMPEMRMRVLVYAERPSDRFLLLNDRRLREGDELEPGLRLEEIRRDRAIFSYRNYLFHLKG